MPACEAYQVPGHIRKHIDYITPGIKLLAPVQSHRSKRHAILAKERAKGLSARNNHSLLKVQMESLDSEDLSTCDFAITPACVSALYKIPKGTSHNRENSLGIFESELEFYTQKDLDSFFTNFASFIPNGTHPKAANVDGGQQATKDLNYAGEEANLDLQLAYPIIYPQTITLYQVDDFIVQSNQNDTYTFGFNTFLDALDGVSCLSRTINIIKAYIL